MKPSSTENFETILDHLVNQKRITSKDWFILKIIIDKSSLVLEIVLNNII